MDRRELLKLAGVSMLGLAGAAVAPGIATASATKSTADAPEVIVIGGGFAGVTATRELSREGLDVLLLEARDRLGGRTFTGKFGPYTTEFGGTWVHWAQPHVWAEITRYGLAVTESPVNSIERVTWLSGGKPKTADAQESAAMMVSALQKYSNVDGMDGLKLFPRPIDATFVDEYRRFDGQSLASRLEQAKLSPDEEALVNAWVTAECGNDPSVGGLVDHVRWYRLCDGSFQQMNDRLVRYKIKDGTHALIEAMVKDARARVRLSMSVVRLEQIQERVNVHTATGQVFKARAAIIAVPMNTLGRIEFSPALSEGKRAAAREKHANRTTKFWYKLKQRVGLWQGLAPWPNPISATFAEHDEPDGTMLVAFGPPSAVNVNDVASVQHAVRTLIPDAIVTKAAGHNWSDDPFSDGAWCWYRPNQMTRYFKALQAREGNCFFASADSANGWRGFIDGAVESGLRVAHDVVRALRS
jgi:monoamine oxidase